MPNANIKCYKLINFKQLRKRWLKAGIVGLLPEQALFFAYEEWLDLYAKIKSEIYPISVDFATEWFNNKLPGEGILFLERELIILEASIFFEKWVDSVIYPSCIKKEDREINKLTKKSRLQLKDLDYGGSLAPDGIAVGFSNHEECDGLKIERVQR